MNKTFLLGMTLVGSMAFYSCSNYEGQEQDLNEGAEQVITLAVANGNNIATFTPQMQEIFSETTSYKMVSMLQNVIDHGSGRRVRFRYGLQMPMGGKTGTTQNHSDGWFMGFTPKLVTGVWVGGEDRSIHFDRLSEGQGANMSLPIWALYMQRVLADPALEYTVDDEFDIPPTFNPNAGCRADDF